MARAPYFLCAALAAAALSFGVRELLRGDGPRPAAELPPGTLRSADASAAGRDELRAVEAPAPPPLVEAGAESTEDSVDDPRKPQISEQVTLFDGALSDEDFASRERWQVGLGLTDEGPAFANDRISAVEIPAGLQATLFDDAHGQGFKLTLGPGTHDLRPYAFDNRVSSIEVSRYGQAVDVGGPEGCVVLYEHRGPDLGGRGLAWRLDLPRGRDEWTFTAARKDFVDDQASTAWIALGFELVLFDDPGASGVALVLGPGLHELELLGFNDRASSARVRRVR